MPGTITAAENFDPETQAKYLRKAMRGLGTNEQQIRDTLVQHSNEQRQEIRQHYKAAFGRDLIEDLKSELGGHFEDTCLALMTPSDKYDAVELHDRCWESSVMWRGMDSDGKVLAEILCSRSNESIKNMRKVYKELYKQDMEEFVKQFSMGDHEKMLVSLLQGERETNEEVDQEKAVKEARELYDAGENMLGTDESVFNLILCKRSFPQLQATFDEYDKISDRTIEEALRSEMSGWLLETSIAIVRFTRDPIFFFAERLRRSIEGAGTDDMTLIRILVSRSEIDLQDIKNCYQEKYGISLRQDVAEDTSGDYRKILLQIIGV